MSDREKILVLNKAVKKFEADTAIEAQNYRQLQQGASLAARAEAARQDFKWYCDHSSECEMSFERILLPIEHSLEDEPPATEKCTFCAETDGLALVQLRMPMRVNQFGQAEKLMCPSCRGSRKSQWRYVPWIE